MPNPEICNSLQPNQPIIFFGGQNVICKRPFYYMLFGCGLFVARIRIGFNINNTKNITLTFPESGKLEKHVSKTDRIIVGMLIGDLSLQLLEYLVAAGIRLMVDL